MCDAIICGLFTKEFGPNGPMRIVQCENDPPDFIITKRKYSVSVEVTYVSEPCVIAPLQYTLNSIVKKTIKILDKNKSVNRAGKVQLIDASHCYEPRRKSIGTKRNDITDRCRNLIVKAYVSFLNNRVYADD